MLAPAQFLPLAEESGLIGDLGSAMLRLSLAQLAQWRAQSDAFADVSLAVNLSARQLTHGGFHDEVADALAQSGIDADSLHLEITGTVLMSDGRVAAGVLRKLREQGVHDRSFVDGLGVDADDSSVVEAVVRLGHSLGLRVVAEGVETPLHLARLQELGCELGHGYLFSRPRPASMVEVERVHSPRRRPPASSGRMQSLRVRQSGNPQVRVIVCRSISCASG